MKKYSRFNLSFIHEGQNIVFNSFSKEFLMLNPFLFQLLEACKESEGWEELKTVHPDFYHHLAEKGFIVDAAIDETEKLRKKVEAIAYNRERFMLIINPTMNCNFKCWYCYESHIKNSRINDKTFDKIKKFITHTLYENEVLKHFHLSFFGGEPLLYYKKLVQPLMDFTKEQTEKKNVVLETSFTTNGYLINEEMLEHFKGYKEHLFFQITLDGNKEEHDKVRYVSKNKGSYQEIIHNIKKLVRSEIVVHTRFNITQSNISSIKGIAEDFYEVEDKYHPFLDFSFHKVWQEKADLETEIRGAVDFFRKKGFTATFNVDANLVENPCYADKEGSAVINYDGNLFKCTARDFTKNNSEGVMDEQGIPKWNKKNVRRRNIKFKNKPCLSCAIQPICNEGCSQQALENFDRDYCVVEESGMTKEEKVRNLFLSHL